MAEIDINDVAYILEDLTRYIKNKFRKDSTDKTITDGEIVSCKNLLKTWEPNILVTENECFLYTINNKVYRVREGQGHTTQADWTPDITPDMWSVIDIAHSGTLEDPIPASRGMDYIVGKYYLDPEDNKVYLCKRQGMEDGQTINLQYLPHEVAIQYFELVE